MNENLVLKSKHVAHSLVNDTQTLKEEDSVALSLKNENAFLKKKVKFLKKDLSRFVKGKRKLNVLFRIKKPTYDKGGFGFIHGKHDKNQKNFFVKAT